MSGAIYIEITATRGSAPRDAGTAMKVTAEATTGTIGGGALEHQAIRIARQMLTNDAPELTRSFPLGPGLGQCCGGSVKLLFTRDKRSTDMEHFHVHPLKTQPAHPAFLWLWGAGHVGRAVMRAAHPQAFKITWVDDAADRFPSGPLGADARVIAADMPRLAMRAPVNAHHLIFTYSHDIDLALCAALLERGFASCGLIGSETKWTRFDKRLRALGLDPAPITCPIGDKSLGKAPDAIARGCVNRLLALMPEGETA
ncbi:xanthine dehydrogenase accessory protein XdhC [Sulfitobacter sp. EhC04]|uniref:xanthine dehydrogenase accessory protein XdhC n=1 Tax=Sulfitobacter sp. EhC04 TaxID=1849168 RepID=UPI0007F4725D|nr:xanthine dehydrogenase accessory protein XdhC [Sulfitobacter sp. EhC04]OAN77031.1 xanthine dehydrogenase accessory protein XdhC [Sulfitobacter sp. EhC04]